MKILIVVGARPNFIKISPLFEKFKRFKRIKPILVHTGQHYDFEMSQIFFQSLKIPKPDYNLEVGSGFHGEQTGKIIIGLEKTCFKTKPDLVMVFGDVNSTLAGALVAAKLCIPIVHVEAGLRCYDKSVPEEINRVITDHISDILFCPSKIAVENLKKEGITKGVYNVGDIMYESFLRNSKIAQKKSRILYNLKVRPRQYYLVTVHRPSNTDLKENLASLFNALSHIKEKVIFSIHPRTKKMLKIFKIRPSTTIKIIDPVDYLDLLMLEKNSKMILTDSGGIQKEAYFCKIPCLILRENTEWIELVKAGWNKLVGNNQNGIISGVLRHKPPIHHPNFYGRGKTSQLIINLLLKNYG